jgi:hypothetical protein
VQYEEVSNQQVFLVPKKDFEMFLLLTKKSFGEKFLQLFGESFSNCFREFHIEREDRKIDV